MSQQNIDFGSFPNDPSADAIRIAFQKVQNNFDEIYSSTMSTKVESINRTPGAGITVSAPVGNIIISANIACVRVATSSLSIGRGSNGSTTANITSSSQVLVLDINPDHVYSNYFASVGNGLASFNGTLTEASNAQPNITSLGTLISLDITGNLTSGNANLGNLATANYFQGDGGLLSNVSTYIDDDVLTDDTFYPVYTAINSGKMLNAYVSTTKLTFNPNFGALSAIAVNSLSDATLKTNVKPITDSMYVIEQLNGVDFDWVDGSGSSYGFIAQDVEKIVPKIVGKTGKHKTVNYSALIPFLVETIKEHQKEITELKTKISRLEK